MTLGMEDPRTKGLANHAVPELCLCPTALSPTTSPATAPTAPTRASTSRWPVLSASDPQAASIETLSNTSDIAMTANDAKFLARDSPRTVELWAKAGGRYYYNIVSYGSDFAIGVGNRHRRSGPGSTAAIGTGRPGQLSRPTTTS